MRIRKVWMFLVAVLLSSSLVFGQESRGTILGRVVDPSGAVIAGTKVQAINVATNTGASSVTNQEGNYEIPYLLSGIYRITAELAGFKKSVRDGIQLRVNDRLILDFTLEIGDVTESVVVTGETPLVESAAASAGIIMDERFVSEIPILGGNAIYLARLSPGVTSVNPRGNGQNIFDQQAGTTTITVNGTRSGSNEVTLDGLTTMQERDGTYAAPQDLVQEVKVHTASYDASLGHAAGGIISVSTKSGTNTLHGTVHLFDGRLDAIDWFSNKWLYDPTTGPITEEKRKKVALGRFNQRWGVTLRGPLVIPHLYNGRNRSFFSFGFDRSFEDSPVAFTGTAPTPEQLQGDFSGLLKLGSQYQIYDPATIAPAPGGRFSRQPLPGNIIPASRIDPMAKKLASYWTQPNNPGTADGSNNYYACPGTPRDWRAPIARVDHNLNDNHRLFFRVNHHDYYLAPYIYMPTIAFGERTDRVGSGLVLNDVYVFNPQLLLNVRYGVNYATTGYGPRSRVVLGFGGPDLLALGFPQSLLNEIKTKNNPPGISFPQITVDGFTGLGAAGGYRYATYYQTFGSTVTSIRGGHSMKFGGEFRLMRENGYDFGNVAPKIDFGTTWTKGPLDNSPAAPIGQGLASMLLGIPSGGQININASRAEQSTYSSFFVHDDWRITSRLTLNIGLRWEYESPTTERFNRTIRGFDFQTPNPVSARALANYAQAPIAQVPISDFRTLGGLTFAGIDSQPRGLWSADKNNFAPRVGLAYQLTPKTVVRAGYGIFYDVVGIDRQDVNQGGFNQATDLIPSLDNGLTFRATLANSFPDGLQLPAGAAGGLRTFLGRGVSFFNENMPNPYMQRWSFSIQRELPMRILSEAAYVGNRGTKLGTSRQLNPVPRQYLSISPVRDQATIDLLSAQVKNPFYGISEFAGTGLGGVNVSRSQLLRPYPHFTGISVALPNGFSWYHSLQVRVEKRLEKGLTFQSVWTWSKFMEATGYLNETNLVPEKVISDQDRSHRFGVIVVYELPFGKGKPLFGGARGLLNQLIGGWQLQGWYEAQTGRPFGFGNAIFYGDLHDIPLPVSQRSVEQWFNVDAGFERDSKKQLANNIRTFSTRFNNVRSDGTNSFDLSLFKNFVIREGWKLQFRMEAFNALNHVQFGNPNTTPTSTAFGTIGGKLGMGSRLVAFAIKLMF